MLNLGVNKAMKFMKCNNPVLLLLGIGISNLGAWVYLIALNLIVLDITDSPLVISQRDGIITEVIES